MLTFVIIIVLNKATLGIFLQHQAFFKRKLGLLYNSIKSNVCVSFEGPQTALCFWFQDTLKYCSTLIILGGDVVQWLSNVRLFATPWTVACQVPLSMGFPRQEYWSRLSFPSPGDLHFPGIESASHALQADSFTAEPLRMPTEDYHLPKIIVLYICFCLVLFIWYQHIRLYRGNLSWLKASF